MTAEASTRLADFLTAFECIATHDSRYVARRLLIHVVARELQLARECLCRNCRDVLNAAVNEVIVEGCGAVPIAVSAADDDTVH